MPKKEFNYVIGRYWEGENGRIASFMLYNNQVHFGTIKEAESDLNYVKERSEKGNYKIFVVKEIEKE